jgi:hypothetical protein
MLPTEFEIKIEPDALGGMIEIKHIDRWGSEMIFRHFDPTALRTLFDFLGRAYKIVDGDGELILKFDDKNEFKRNTDLQGKSIFSYKNIQPEITIPVLEKIIKISHAAKQYNYNLFDPIQFQVEVNLRGYDKAINTLMKLIEGLIENYNNSVKPKQ